jgi:hypothetical protein
LYIAVTPFHLERKLVDNLFFFEIDCFVDNGLRSNYMLLGIKINVR